MNGCATMWEIIAKSIRDEIRSVVNGYEPRYCTIVIGSALSSDRMTLLKCAGEPKPAEPTLRPLGLLFQRSSNCGMVLAGLSGGTAMKFNRSNSAATGSKSFNGS